jgi:hypothetical protein
MTRPYASNINYLSCPGFQLCRGALYRYEKSGADVDDCREISDWRT